MISSVLAYFQEILYLIKLFPQRWYVCRCIKLHLCFILFIQLKIQYVDMMKISVAFVLHINILLLFIIENRLLWFSSGRFLAYFNKRKKFLLMLCYVDYSWFQISWDGGLLRDSNLLRLWLFVSCYYHLFHIIWWFGPIVGLY